MYEAPIEMISQRIGREIAHKTDEMVIQEVTRVGVNVDKDELIKALQYDRQQYQKGYEDARRDLLKTGMEDLKRYAEDPRYYFTPANYRLVCKALGWEEDL